MTTQDPRRDPASPPPKEAVRPAVRITSVLVSIVILSLAAIGPNKTAQLGLASIAGGTLLLTPQVIEAFFGSDTTTRFGETYLRVVTLLTCTGVILALLGVDAGKIYFPGINSLKLTVLIIAAILEVTITFGLLPVWLVKSGRDAMSRRRVDVLDDRWERCTSKPRSWLAKIEDGRHFARLGGLLFLIGIILQFIAGSEPTRVKEVSRDLVQSEHKVDEKASQDNEKSAVHDYH